MNTFTKVRRDQLRSHVEHAMNEAAIAALALIRRGIVHNYSAHSAHIQDRDQLICQRSDSAHTINTCDKLGEGLLQFCEEKGWLELTTSGRSPRQWQITRAGYTALKRDPRYSVGGEA